MKKNNCPELSLESFSKIDFSTCPEDVKDDSFNFFKQFGEVLIPKGTKIIDHCLTFQPLEKKQFHTQYELSIPFGVSFISIFFDESQKVEVEALKIAMRESDLMLDCETMTIKPIEIKTQKSR